MKSLDAQQLVERVRPPDVGAELPRAFDREPGIGADDLHAERDGGVRDEPADRARAR